MMGGNPNKGPSHFCRYDSISIVSLNTQYRVEHEHNQGSAQHLSPENQCFIFATSKFRCTYVSSLKSIFIEHLIHSICCELHLIGFG